MSLLYNNISGMIIPLNPYWIWIVSFALLGCESLIIVMNAHALVAIDNSESRK